MARILVVDDDAALNTNLLNWLSREGHEVAGVENAAGAFAKLAEREFDLIVLDWDLPDLSGIQICNQLRQARNAVLILMLTGKADTTDKETGLDTGADDYLTKPFSVKELSARIKALLRRPSALLGNRIKVRHLTLDVVEQKLFANDTEVELMPKEFALIAFLLRHTNYVFSADELIARVWPSSVDLDPEALRTYVARLRAKIDIDQERSMIRTVHGLGFIIDDP